MIDRDFDHPPTFSSADVERAHAAAVEELARHGYSILPASLDVLTQLRRARVAIDRDAIFECCAQLGLPLADAPREREHSFRRVF